MARRFPFLIGRASGSHLVLPSEGVWDHHALIQFRPAQGFFLETDSGALVSVNGERTTQARLRNGDVIECGSVQLRFWLAPLRQKGLRAREGLTWMGLALLLGLEAALVYWLVG